jgi:hypothetical protein
VQSASRHPRRSRHRIRLGDRGLGGRLLEHGARGGEGGRGAVDDLAALHTVALLEPRSQPLDVCAGAGTASASAAGGAWSRYASSADRRSRSTAFLHMSRYDPPPAEVAAAATQKRALRCRAPPRRRKRWWGAAAVAGVMEMGEALEYAIFFSDAASGLTRSDRAGGRN